MILDHIARARRMGLAYVYLGYWVRGSKKMDYKGRFLPQERLTPDGWIAGGERVSRRHGRAMARHRRREPRSPACTLAQCARYGHTRRYPDRTAA